MFWGQVEFRISSADMLAIMAKNMTLFYFMKQNLLNYLLIYRIVTVIEELILFIRPSILNVHHLGMYFIFVSLLVYII